MRTDTEKSIEHKINEAVRQRVERFKDRLESYVGSMSLPQSETERGHSRG